MNEVEIVTLLKQLPIQDFMICTGVLEECNYVLITNNKNARSLLCSIGMTADELERASNERVIDIYPFLIKKGISYSPLTGFSA